MDTKALCPCRQAPESKESKLTYGQCCGPILSGQAQAQDTEQLLRARYTAFTLAEVDFVLNTHHPKTRKDVSRDEVTSWATGSRWMGLEVVQKEAGGPQDSTGTIIFCARYQDKDAAADAAPHEHWEQALFERDPSTKAWMFLDARGVQQGTYRRTEPKVGRNDPCPCGSGKKFKKCHAAGV